jgi:hypothetical protein
VVFDTQEDSHGVGLVWRCPRRHDSCMFTSKIPDGVGLVWRCVFSEVSDLWRRDGRPVMLPHHRACVLRGLDMLFATGPDSFDVARLDRLGRGPGMIPAVDVRVARSLLAPSGPGPRVVFLVTTPRFVARKCGYEPRTARTYGYEPRTRAASDHDSTESMMPGVFGSRTCTERAWAET